MRDEARDLARGGPNSPAAIWSSRTSQDVAAGRHLLGRQAAHALRPARSTATIRPSASNRQMPWRMLSSITCRTSARLLRLRLGARASAVMSTWVTMKPPSGVGSDETSSTRPSGVSRTARCGSRRSRASAACGHARAPRLRARAAPLGVQASDQVVERAGRAGSSPGRMPGQAWLASALAATTRRSGP